MRQRHTIDKRPYTLDIHHPALGEVSEDLPSARMAISRAKLHEAEGADVVVLSPDGNPVYSTDDGTL